MELCGSDAGAALDAMDKICTNGGITGGHEDDTLKTMRKLAQNSGLIPARYQVARCSLSVEADAIASGAFTNVQGGRLGGIAVTTRTLRVDQRVCGDDFRKLFCKECTLWMNLSHPNIMRLIGVDIDSQIGRYSVITEMAMNGNIKEYTHKNSTNRHRLLRDAAAGLCYLHQQGIVHGDLEVNNILITGDTPPQVCLADFGLSSLVPRTDGAANAMAPNITLLYMAPELLSPARFGRSSATPTKPADIYAFGMVVYEVLTGSQPFCEEDWPSVDQIVDGKRPEKPQDAERAAFVNGTWGLVEECWTENPAKRPTVDRIREFLTGTAGFSIEIDPTLEISQNSRKSSPAAQSSSSTTVATKPKETSLGNPTIPMRRVITIDRAASPVSIVNMTNARSSHPVLLEERARGSHPPRTKKPPPRTSNPPPTEGSQHSTRIDPRTIILKWRTLKNTGPTEDVQLSPLVDEHENRKIAENFNGKYANTVINAIDKALKETEVSEQTKLNACKMLRQLAARNCQVPDSYLVGRWTRFTVEKQVTAIGGEADVRRGRLRNMVVAVKTFRASKDTNVHHMHKNFCKESVLWMNVSHPNVLKLLAVDINPGKKQFSMVSEMMTNGNIMKYIGANEADLPGLLKDVARGLQYLHRAGIVHGDIKGANILINSHIPPQACIADFGLCAFLPTLNFDPTTKKDVRGTLGYMAPELHGCSGEPTKAADMYAFGTVIREVITGIPVAGRRGAVRRLTSPCSTSSEVWHSAAPCSSEARHPAPPRPNEVPETFPFRGFEEETWDFMARCRDRDPKERPTAGEAVEHFERIASNPTLVDPIPGSSDGEATSGLSNSGRDDPLVSRFCYGRGSRSSLRL